MNKGQIIKNQSLGRKFTFAWNGIVHAIKHEDNLKRHVVSGLIVICFFGWLNISAIWWALISLSIGLVIAAELANSAIEALIDYLHPEIHEQIGHVKDMLAGMVLILSIVAVLIGLLAIASVLV